MNLELLYGVYELQTIESFKDGQKTNEKANEGMFTFTRMHKLSVVSGSNEWVMAYAGSFELNENILSIQIKSCVVREMENTTIIRKVVIMNGIQLVLDATGSDRSKTTQITWKKIVSL